MSVALLAQGDMKYDCFCDLRAYEFHVMTTSCLTGSGIWAKRLVALEGRVDAHSSDFRFWKLQPLSNWLSASAGAKISG